MLDMEDDDNASQILLGRPLLKTVRTKVNVFEGVLTMEHEDKVVIFDFLDTILGYSLNMIDLIAQDFVDHDNKKKVNITKDTSVKGDMTRSTVVLEGNVRMCKKGKISSLISSIANKEYSIMQVKKMDRKPFPRTMKSYGVKID